MKVSDLIKILQSFPPGLTVVTEGYEEGYDIVKEAILIKVTENPNKEWYVGKYLHSKDPDAEVVCFLNADTKSGNK